MLKQKLPCVAEMYGLEVTFVEGDMGKYKTIELWFQSLDCSGPVIFTDYNRFNKDKILMLYKKMENKGFKLPSLADFAAGLLSIMKKYDEGSLQVIEPKYSRPIRSY